MRSKIVKLLQEHGVLNTYQTCRLLNGEGKNEYSICYFSFKEKPLGTSAPHKRACKNYKKCKIKVTSVWSLLMRMNIPSKKMRFFDSGGIGTDLFRFFFLDKKVFEKQILSQTLIPYVQEGKNNG